MLRIGYKASAEQFGARDLLVHARYGKAALFAIGLPYGGKNLGIDQSQQFVAGFGRVDDDYLLVHVHLGSGKADAGRGIHGFCHVGNQAAYALVYFRYWRRDLVQAGIGIAQDR